MKNKGQTKFKFSMFFSLLFFISVAFAVFAPSVSYSQSCPNPGPADPGFQWVSAPGGNCWSTGAFTSPSCTWSGGTCNASTVGDMGIFEEYSGPPNGLIYCVSYYGCEAIPPPGGSVCSINSFTADDDTPLYNSGTTIRFSLSGSYPWVITLVDGTTNPSQTFGTWDSGASDTGNLTVSHTYLLNCNNGDAFLPLTVTPEAQQFIDDAQFISQVVPSAMITNEVQQVYVTMKNIGDTTWTASDEYKLGSQNPQNNGIWGVSRDFLGGSESIDPGETKEFSFTITAPAVAGTYDFQWRMVKEFVRWFGEYSNNIRIDVNAPVLPPVHGACGTANKNYQSWITSYGSDTFCTSGTTSPASPAFPAQGGGVGWSCLGSNGGTDSSCTASRSSIGAEYTVRAITTMGGYVKSFDNVIDTRVCGTDCTKSYAQNSTVTLLAVPSSAYWKFNGWFGDCSGTGLCNLTVDVSKTVTAIFVPRSFNYQEF